MSDVRNMLCVIVGVKTGRKRPRRKAEQTEVVEGDRLVRENQNLAVSCTDFVHALSPPRKDCTINFGPRRWPQSHVPGSLSGLGP